MCAIRLELFEYDSQVVGLSDDEARRLAASAPKALTVSPASIAGRWTVKADCWIGTMNVDDISVLIRPKIRPENVFMMLESGLTGEAFGPDTFNYAVTGDLLRAVVALFVRTAELALGRGPLHAYRSLQEPLATVRGRLDVPAAIARAGLLMPIDCEFDEFTADVIENRCLKAALRRALRIPALDPNLRHGLHRLLVPLSEVADVEVPAEKIDQVVISRLNQHYRPTLDLARLILKNLTLVDARGAVAATTFLVDMNVLFQRFMTWRLRSALLGALTLGDEPRWHLDDARSVGMDPDLEFRRGEQTVMVGDLKYKLAAAGKGRTSDYYQLLAYATALNLDDGVLIYCGTAHRDRPLTVLVRHTGKRLHTWSVDLTGPASAVSAEITRLANWIVESSGSVGRDGRSAVDTPAVR